MSNKIKYNPEICECCNQSKTYILGVDHGTAHILKAFARFIGKKGINCAHVHKELLAQGYLTANQRSNVSRPRSHGLIAKVKGERGNYLLTKKGAAFLRGESIPKYAIMDKATKHQVGYFEEEKCRVEIQDLNNEGEYWEGINYDVIEGRIIPNTHEGSNL